MPAAVQLSEMVDLALGTPEVGSVNFNVLHTLLHAMICKLGISDTKAELTVEDEETLKNIRPEDRANAISRGSAATKDSGLEETDGEDASIRDRERSQDEILPKKRSHYHALESKVAKIEKQLCDLNQLPSNSDLIDRTRDISKGRPVSDMWQTMQLAKRVDANEAGVGKLMSFIEDLLKEMQDLRKDHDAFKRLIDDLNVNELRDKLKKLEDITNTLNDKFSLLPPPEFYDDFITWKSLEDALTGLREDLKPPERVVIEMSMQTDPVRPTSSKPSKELKEMLEKLGLLTTRHGELEVRVDTIEDELKKKADKEELDSIKVPDDLLSQLKQIQDDVDSLLKSRERPLSPVQTRSVTTSESVPVAEVKPVSRHTSKTHSGGSQTASKTAALSPSCSMLRSSSSTKSTNVTPSSKEIVKPRKSSSSYTKLSTKISSKKEVVHELDTKELDALKERINGLESATKDMCDLGTKVLSLDDQLQLLQGVVDNMTSLEQELSAMDIHSPYEADADQVGDNELNVTNKPTPCADGAMSVDDSGSDAMEVGRSAPDSGRRAKLDGQSAPGSGRRAKLDGRSAPDSGSGATLDGTSATGIGSGATIDGQSAPGSGRGAKLDGRSAPDSGSGATLDGTSATGSGSGATIDGRSAPGSGSGATIDGRSAPDSASGASDNAKKDIRSASDNGQGGPVASQVFGQNQEISKLERITSQTPLRKASSRMMSGEQYNLLQNLIARNTAEVKHLTQKMQKLNLDSNSEFQHTKDKIGKTDKVLLDLQEKIETALIQAHHSGVNDRDQANQQKDTEALNRAHRAISQLQSEIDKLVNTTQFLLDENTNKTKQIEEIIDVSKQLEERKANKEYVDISLEEKADKKLVDSKLSSSEFHSTIGEINKAINDILNKLEGHDEEWKLAIAELSKEIDNKIDRLELDALKDYLESRLKALSNKIKNLNMTDMSDDDAAGIRKQLVQRFHCISCDRPVDMFPHGPVPSLPGQGGLPGTRSSRPYTTFELEQIRQQAKLGSPPSRPNSVCPFLPEIKDKKASDIPRLNAHPRPKSVATVLRDIKDFKDKTSPQGCSMGKAQNNFDRSVYLRHMARMRKSDFHAYLIHFGKSVANKRALIPESPRPSPQNPFGAPDIADQLYSTARPCGGSHTMTYPHKRVTRLTHLSNLFREDDPVPAFKEELDIQGADGHIYKGRVDRLPAVQNTQQQDRDERTFPPLPSAQSNRPMSPSMPGRSKTMASPASARIGGGSPEHRPMSGRSTSRPHSANPHTRPVSARNSNSNVNTNNRQSSPTLFVPVAPPPQNGPTEFLRSTSPADESHDEEE